MQLIDKRTGKERCAYLRQIRVQVAKEHNIEYVPAECTHEGDCSGTCPQCEKELRELTFAINHGMSEDDAVQYSLHFDSEKEIFIIQQNC